MKYEYTRAAFGRHSFIEVEKNVKLHISDLGKGEPIVFIHGLPFNNTMFEYQHQFFVKTGYRVISISLRGFGFSDKPYGKYNYNVFADDIKIILETLEVDNAMLVGFSTGAAAAIRYAARYNGAHINRLVLCSAAVPFLAEKYEPMSIALNQNIDELIRLINSDHPAFFKKFAGLCAGNNQFVLSNIIPWFDNIYTQASPYAIEQGLLLLRDAALYTDLKETTLPAAIFHGKKDEVFPFDLAERLYDLIPHAWFVPFENSGHALFLEEMEKFNLSLMKFMRLGIAKQAAAASLYY